MKKKLIVLLFLIVCFYAQALIDLNTASYEELKTLPITQKQAKDIYEYREFVSFFKSIFDLRNIDSVDQETLLEIRPLVKVSHYTDVDETAQRREEIGYLLERLGNSEGSSEGMNDIWQDFLMSPQNINSMLYEDLISIPNVSSVDAVAILNRRAMGDSLKSVRDIRTSQGISYYGYSNLKHYVFFEDPKENRRMFVDYQFKAESQNFEDDAIDMYKQPMLRDTYQVDYDDLTDIQNEYRRKDNSYWGYFNLGAYSPAVTNKLRVRYGNQFKFGMMNYSGKSLPSMTEQDWNTVRDDSKYYAGYEDSFRLNSLGLGNVFIKSYLGNYRATYGEGLVMENTDFYSPRKTGHGFSKRILGITPDLSKTQEYALKGGAVELKNNYFTASMFYSKDKKDALVYMERVEDEDGNVHSVPVKDENGNYKVFSYINSTVRFDNEDLAEAEVHLNNETSITGPTYNGGTTGYNIDYINLAPRRDIMNEEILGTHLQVNPFIGTHIGFTTYTAVYDNAEFMVPEGQDLISLLLRDESTYDKWKLPSNEIEAMYSTKTDSYDKDYRRVIGFDAGTVINNVAIDGEYAELSVDGDDMKLGDDPKAYIAKAHTQYNNVYFLTLYRHYDLDFDNPYSNAFAEHNRYDDTAFDKITYGMTNPLISDVYYNSSQAQAEEGVYFETRYQFHRNFILGRTYLDIWERLSDARNSVRFQSELEYRAFHQLRFKLKYKNQTNRYADDADRGVSKTQEYTLSARMLLSNRDYLDIEYRYNTVKSPPYVSLTNPVQEGDNTHAQAMTLMNGDYIAANYTHYFSTKLKVRGSVCFWNGYDLSHWDWEDVELDFMGDRGFKYWFSIQDQVSENIYVAFKYKNKFYRTQEMFIRKYNSTDDPSLDGMQTYYDRVEKKDHTFRIQIDYRF